MAVFFFKQKTAYEMRISESSDVCSSDLCAANLAGNLDAASCQYRASSGQPSQDHRAVGARPSPKRFVRRACQPEYRGGISPQSASCLRRGPMPRTWNSDETHVGSAGLRCKARVRGHDAILGALLGAGWRRGSYRYARHHPPLPADICCLMAGGFYIDVNVAAGKPSEGHEIFQRAPDFTVANVGRASCRERV